MWGPTHLAHGLEQFLGVLGTSVALVVGERERERSTPLASLSVGGTHLSVICVSPLVAERLLVSLSFFGS